MSNSRAALPYFGLLMRPMLSLMIFSAATEDGMETPSLLPDCHTVKGEASGCLVRNACIPFKSDPCMVMSLDNSLGRPQFCTWSSGETGVIAPTIALAPYMTRSEEHTSELQSRQYLV